MSDYDTIFRGTACGHEEALKHVQTAIKPIHMTRADGAFQFQGNPITYCIKWAGEPGQPGSPRPFTVEPAECEVVGTDRQIIENKLLESLEGDGNVALLVNRYDLAVLIAGLDLLNGTMGSSVTSQGLARDMKKLQAAAFPPDDQPPPPADGKEPCLSCGARGKSLEPCPKCGEIILPF